MAQLPRPRHPKAEQVRWRKSSFSSANGECVEVATTPTHVLLRDSKNPHGAHLTLTPAEWTAFLSGVHSDEFDLA
jgi:hypothetical protein